jgi:hypothetical protein
LRPLLTEKIALESLNNFFRLTPFILFGTGASCAVDPAFGMEALKNYLVKNLSSDHMDDIQKEQWATVLDKLEKGIDLENAMYDVRDERLIRDIINYTASHVGIHDREYGTKIFKGKKQWPTAVLIKIIFDGLPDSKSVLHVATTNYDLLAEYAFEHMEIPYITGFYGGFYRRWNWNESIRQVTRIKQVPRQGTFRSVPDSKKHIRLYKVHGSLNTFICGSDIIETNAWVHETGSRDGFERLMITPGTSKYEVLHAYRNELLGKYDEAVETHDAFLFIGFGFNDNQITNNSIRRKLKDQKCPALIITRDSNPRIDDYISDCDNIWLVCKPPDLVHGSRIINSGFRNYIDIPDKLLWNIEVFTNEILGG